MFPRHMYPSLTLFKSHNHGSGMADMVDSKLIEHASGFVGMFAEEKYAFIKNS